MLGDNTVADRGRHPLERMHSIDDHAHSLARPTPCPHLLPPPPLRSRCQDGGTQSHRRARNNCCCHPDAIAVGEAAADMDSEHAISSAP